MNKVKLEIWKKGSRIIAPDFCPYKVQEKDVHREYTSKGDGYSLISDDLEIFTVNSSLCPLCKLCNFIPNTIDKETELRTDKFVEYLTLVNEEVATLINNQNFYLRKKDRIPLTILINPEIFDMMLKLVYKDNIEEYNKVHSYFINNEIPICFILGCPVYLSRKLTKSKVMVIGEIEWK